MNTTGKASYLKAADSTGVYSSFGKTKFNSTWIDNTDTPSLLVIEDEIIEFGFYTLPALSTGVLEITLDKVVGINENSSSNGIRMYPNPATNQVQLFVPQEINISSISIYSISGELVKNIEVKKEEDINIDITDFHSGVYMVKINHQDGESILKLIKNK